MTNGFCGDCVKRMKKEEEQGKKIQKIKEKQKERQQRKEEESKRKLLDIKAKQCKYFKSFLGTICFFTVTAECGHQVLKRSRCDLSWEGTLNYCEDWKEKARGMRKKCS